MQDTTASIATPHSWHFLRAGGVDQVVIRTGADIANLSQLDQKLWVALACPVRGIEFDPATIALINQDGDDRIRAPELLHACEWAVAQVNDPEVLATGSDVLQLSSLRTDTPEGQAMLDEARRILVQQGCAEASTITLADVQTRLNELHAMLFNGDSLLNPAKLAAATDLPEADTTLAELARRIMDAYGADTGCDGEPGLDQTRLDRFFADVQALADWHAAQPTSPADADATTAAQAVAAVQAKVDDYFARVRLAAFDARALTPLNPAVEGYAALAPQTLGADHAAIAALPLAVITTDGTLPLREGTNPAWDAALHALREHAVLPLLGDIDRLTPAQWAQLQAHVAPARQWLDSMPSTPIAGMTQAEVQQLLASDTHARLTALIAQDAAEKDHEAQAQALRKLIHLQRDLLVLLNNFVSFSRFYHRKPAIFQAGTLYLDGRSCDLTVDVADPAAHPTLAGLAKMYLAYCECRRGGKKRHIVAAFTAGDVDFLFVGRNGVFYDREGQDWDATITKLVENPISIWQAFFSPYKKFLRMIEEQVAKRAAEKDATVLGNLDAKATQLVNNPSALTPPAAGAGAAPTATGAKKMDVGTVAALGVALGSISTVLVAVFSQFVGLGPWIPVALLGVMLAISGPSMLIAWLKLRERSLGPILDASGWAINGRMKINLPLGGALSQIGHVPLTAHRTTATDPYGSSGKLRCWLLALLAAIVLAAIAWRMHWADNLLPAHWRHGHTTTEAVTPAAADTPPPAPAASPAPAEAPAPATAS